MKGIFQTSLTKVYSLADLKLPRMEGCYQSKSGYLKFLRKLPKMHTESEISVIGSNFKQLFDKKTEISNIGIGSYLGNPTLEHDRLVFDAVRNAVRNGVNVIDTAANYRYCKAERTIGAALRSLFAENAMRRSDVFLCTKIGYVTEDPDRNMSVTQVIEECVKESRKLEWRGKEITPEAFLAEMHSIHPGYLNYQLEKSLSNLGIGTIDVLYLHNPFESQLGMIGQEAMEAQITAAFQFLENAVLQGKIMNYGIASWNCFRSPPTEVGIHASIIKLTEIAEKVAGKDHHFKFIQMPMNFVAHECYSMNWQKSAVDGELKTALKVCEELGINVITSATFLQTAALKLHLPFQEAKLKSNAQVHLQLIRSMAEPSVKSSLVGMMTPAHVQENCALMKVPSMTKAEFNSFLSKLKPHVQK